jgi:hypothetical protein
MDQKLYDFNENETVKKYLKILVAFFTLFWILYNVIFRKIEFNKTQIM